MNKLDDIGSTLTPEQILASIIIQASKGAYRSTVPRWALSEIANINFDALQPVFDNYLNAKLRAMQTSSVLIIGEPYIESMPTSMKLTVSESDEHIDQHIDQAETK